MVDIDKVMKILSRSRPIFHSEADLQHSLAWQIHCQLPHVSIRLELPFQQGGRLFHLDIWATQGDKALAVELKYKTQKLSVKIDSEQFTLKYHSAQDVNRYKFIKDIWRLEQIINQRMNAFGYAVLVTNDSNYWIKSEDKQPIDADFRIDEDRLLQGILKWGVRASAGTKRGHEKQIELTKRYAVHWKDYHEFPGQCHGKFRYVAIQVGKKPSASCS